MKYFLLTLLLGFLSSCANYVNNVHKQIDYEERLANNKEQSANYYRPPSPSSYANTSKVRYDKRPIQNPVTLQNVQTAQRNTQNKRYTAEDFRDNDNSGSLWSDENRGTFLFTTSQNIKRGDFLVIEVLAGLKDDIQEELKRAYPDVSKKKKDEKDKEEKEEEKAKENSPLKKASNENKVYDKISTQVVQELNQNYLFVKGRKEIFYGGLKRYIEIQAVVPRKDIKDADTVSSDKILQPRIFPLRY